MTLKPFFAFLAAGALTVAVSPATASPALLSGLSAPAFSVVQFGEDCTKGKCKGEDKGEEAPAKHIELGEDCTKGKCKGEDKGEEAPAKHIELGENCTKGKCKGEDKGEEVPA